MILVVVPALIFLVQGQYSSSPFTSLRMYAEDKKRLFIGIPVPPAVEGVVGHLRASGTWSPNITWTPDDNLHLTILFLGAVPVDIIDNLKSLIRIELQATAPFAIRRARLLLAPPAKPARMIWIRYQRNPSYTHLVHRLRDIIGQVYKLPQQHQDPIPHITLARFKSGSLYSLGTHLSEKQELDLHVSKLMLWESVSGPKGPIYVPVERYELS